MTNEECEFRISAWKKGFRNLQSAIRIEETLDSQLLLALAWPGHEPD